MPSALKDLGGFAPASVFSPWWPQHRASGPRRSREPTASSYRASGPKSFYTLAGISFARPPVVKIVYERPSALRDLGFHSKGASPP